MELLSCRGSGQEQLQAESALDEARRAAVEKAVEFTLVKKIEEDDETVNWIFSELEAVQWSGW